MQAELLDFKEDLDMIVSEDRNSGNSQKAIYDRSWSVLSRSIEDGDDLEKQTMLQIRRKRNEYSKYY